MSKPKKSRHVVVAVECDLPPGVTAAQFKRYVEEEVKSNIGLRYPLDPMFRLDRESVRTTVIPRNAEWLLGQTCRGMDSPLYRRWFG